MAFSSKILPPKWRKMITSDSFQGGIFGVLITGINLYNIKLKKRQDNTSRIQYSLVSLAKGVIYGGMYPFSMWGIFLSALSAPDDFNRHFIPLSKYGAPIHHELHDTSHHHTIHHELHDTKKEEEKEKFHHP